MRGKARRDEEFRQEVAAHLEIEADRLVAEGMAPAAARAAAERAFGNVVRVRERFYETRRWMWLDHLRRDLRQARQQIARTPLASAIVVLSLALGIGSNAAIFSLADQALLRALPVAEPRQLVLLDWNGAFVGGGVGSDNLFSHPFYRELAAELGGGGGGVFSGLCARHPTVVHLAVGREAEEVAAEIVSGSYFATLGVRPALGRLLGAGDDVRPEGHPVVVLSYDTWRGRLGGDPHVVGRRVLVNNFPMTVAGVAAAGFRGVDWGEVPALWIPVMEKREATPGWDALGDRRTRWLHIFARLKPGVTAAAARARLAPWFKAYLAADTRREGWPPVTPAQLREYMASTLEVLPAAAGRSDRRRMVREPILILLAATGLILLLACLNVANLSLARALSRARAIALRTALGASRRRIVAEQLLESGLLAAAGCLVGVAVAPVANRAILSFLPGGAGGMDLRAGLDLRMVAFAAVVTVATTLLSGSVPALFAASIAPGVVLKARSSTVAGGMALRKALVVGQCALALILLFGAGLFSRTLAALRAEGPGYSTARLVMFRVDALNNGYAAGEAKAVMRRLLSAIQGLPEVAQAGLARGEMLRGGTWNNPVTVRAAGHTIVTEDLPMNAVSPGFFAALGVPVLRGRDFDLRDARSEASGERRVAIVNQEFVRRYLGGEEAVGARLGIGDGPDTVAGSEIVGVVGSFHDVGLRAAEPQVYFALWEAGVGGGTFYVRARGAGTAGTAGVAAVGRRLRAVVAGVDAGLPVVAMRTVDEQLDRMLANERMLAALAAAFAGAATLLAAIGLYGVLAFAAASRGREIGIRLALGAQRRDASGLIFREAAMLVAVGIGVGLPVAWGLGRLVASQLFGVGALDLGVLGAAVGVLGVVGLAAGGGPARRAGTVSPLETLKAAD